MRSDNMAGRRPRDSDVERSDINTMDRTHPALAGVHSWHIPRPSLVVPEIEYTPSQQQRTSTSSQGSSSNTSTQSGSSGSLLLTAANLASLRCEPMAKPAGDTLSIASSMHFTVVNGLERRRPKPLPSCCCRKHQPTVLVITMSAIFLVAILIAVLYLEMKWRGMHLFS